MTFLAAMWLNINPWPAAPLAVMPIIVIAVIAGAAAWGFVLKRRGSQMLDRLGDVLFMEAEAIPMAQDVEGLPEQPGPPSTSLPVSS